MQKSEYLFPGKQVTHHCFGEIEQLELLYPKERIVVITDTNVRRSIGNRLDGWRMIVIEPGEIQKQQGTVDHIIGELVKLEADRDTCIIGVGGGVITDIAGYVAGIYMRGLNFGFVPTSILAAVDASMGGKNGIDRGLYKNLVGLIRQPPFLLTDLSLLKTLPQEEWVNGFAEIIKHAAIKDEELFEELEKTSLETYQNDEEALQKLIDRNVKIKMGVVTRDETEQGERKLLNFGHTFGHAVENLYNLPHGHAISIGMNMAAVLSEQLNGFSPDSKLRLQQLLTRYGLPVSYPYEKEKLLDLLKMDKKRRQNSIHFILLNRIGEAVVQPIAIDRLYQLLNDHL